MTKTPVSTPTLQAPTQESLNKTKVLHIVKDRKVGGVKSTLYGLINSDLAKEFDFTVLTNGIDKPVFRSLNLRPDIIICHQPFRFKEIPGLVLLRLFNPTAKILIHEHGYSEGYEPFNVPSLSRFHLMLKLSYKLANRVVAISKAQAEWMLKNHLVAPEKLTVINQCPPLDKFSSVTPKPKGTPLVLAAYGRFCLQKGFDILLKALKELSDVPVKLYLGGEGVQEAELKQLAQGLDNVEFCGRVDDVPSFLQACDVVVIPSRWEPWGNVCLEAKAAGRPVIASDVDGLTEQVENCGVLVAPNNPEQLALAIKNLVSLSPTQLDAWGSNGREAVQGKWQQYVIEWKNLLRKV